ncbi:T6SS effector BTH_I2691 family protein [Herbaspirillum rubrisubalbicans]|uniref:Toxin VasX N-terminal region domain-containing protein n=1 Tax=Herbaspirillum rubrisubalbicans TaxID=80842 RepID=A0AAD0UAN6_9BURK|nr:T6SS effector BTH_I2691 family protein [Herbaspirillum rubrisubalbicans]AYR26417.1 hypothetical protein RC54_22510 [Herbaspirillum rubrisubalbicans]
MACTNPQNPDCRNCNKDGLAILLARYAVVPLNIPGDVPAPLGNKVTGTALTNYKYVLRTLRAGFVYLFYERHPSNITIKWEAYAVSPEGRLWKRPSHLYPEPVPVEPVCTRSGDNIPTSVIHIEHPAKCGRVWIAFSQHAWSEATFKAFASDIKLRDQRMQTFIPKLWISAGGYRHGMVATEGNVQKVLEYNPAYSPDLLNERTTTGVFGSPSGRYNRTKLQANTTIHRSFSRKDEVKPLVAKMEEICTHGKGEKYKPMVMGVWDALGIGIELNNFRNEPAGWMHRYNTELPFQIDGMLTISSLKDLLENHAGAVVDRNADLAKQRAQQYDFVKERAEAQKLPADTREKLLKAIEVQEYVQSKGVEVDNVYQNRITRAAMLPDAARDKEYAQIKADADTVVTSRAAYRKGRVEKAWPPYAEKLDMKAYETFKKNFESLQDEATALIEKRTADMLAWMQSRHFLDGLREYHGDDIQDAVAFESHVSEVTFLLNTTKSGRGKIDEWVNDLQIAESNLMYRLLSMNQDAARTEVSQFLIQAETFRSDQTAATVWNWYAYIQKSMKAIADLYKKAAGVYNANEKAKAGTNVAFNVKLEPYRQFGIDKTASTFGDFIFKKFRLDGKMADMACEKIIQTWFGLRAGVEVAAAGALADAQARYAMTGRLDILERVRASKNPLAPEVPEKETVSSRTLKRDWAAFRDSEKSASAMRDARMALVVLLIESGNFAKMMHDCIEKGDSKSRAGLAASAMTIASGVIDIWGVAVKEMQTANATSYQVMKLGGAGLSVAAGIIGIVFDAQDLTKARSKGQGGIYVLYSLKIGFGVVNILATGASTFTYAAPILLRLTGRVAAAQALDLVGTRVAAAIACRILFMSAGMWIGVLLFIVQVAIWTLSDDDLEIWCTLCVFGTKKGAEAAYKDAAKQREELGKALIAVGVG